MSRAGLIAILTLAAAAASGSPKTTPPGHVASRVDLTISALEVTPTAVPPGGTITISDTIAATGAVSSGFWVRFYLSPDATITTSDTPIGARWVTPVAIPTFPRGLGFAPWRGRGPGLAPVPGKGWRAWVSNHGNGRGSGTAAPPGRGPGLAPAPGRGGAPGRSPPPGGNGRGPGGTDEWSSSGTTTIVLPYDVTGTYWVGAIVDADGGIAESDESDNSRVGGTIEILGDLAPPVITVSGISDGEVTNRTPLSVCIAAEDPHLASLEGVVDGTVNFTTCTDLFLEKDYELVVTASDTGGNTSTVTVRFAIDRTAPKITVSGVSPGEVTTAAVTPAVTIEEAHPGTVDVRLNDQPFSSGTTIDVSGSYVLTVAATDAAGNAATSTVPFVIDRAAPVVAIDSPANGTVTQASQVEVVVTATDDVAVRRVEVNRLAAVAGTDGNYRVTVPLVENDNSLVATAYDTAGNSGTVAVTVRRDSTPPDLAVTEPVEGAVLPTTAVAVSGKVTDATPVKVAVNGIVVTAAADGTFRTTVTAPEGPHDIRIVATDLAGNTTTVVRHVTTDATPPVITVSGASDGEVSNRTPLSVCISAEDPHLASFEGVLDGTVHFTTCTDLYLEKDYELVATASDTAGNTSTVTVRFAIDTSAPVLSIGGVADGMVYALAQVVPVFSANDSHPGTTTATLNGVSFASGTAVTEERDHVLAITATDAAGNVRTGTIGFAIDRTAPKITVSGVSSGEVTREAVTPVVTVEESHPGTVDVRLNGQPFSSGTTIDAPGSYVVTVTATDAGGNPASSTVPFVIDRIAPVVAIDSPASGTVTQASQVEVVVAATDDRGVQRVEVDGVAAVAGSDGKYRVTVSLAEDDNSLVATAHDMAGNSGTATATVRRDSTTPDLVVTEPAEGAVFATTTVAVSGNVTDATAVTLTVGGAAVAIAADGSFQTTVTLTEGSHEVLIVGTDRAGNASTVVRHVTIDLTHPVITVSGVSDGEVTNRTPLSVCIAADDTRLASVEGVVDGTVHFTTCTDLYLEKDYELVATANDTAGNTSTVTVRFAIDLSAPVLSIGGVADGMVYALAQVVPVFSASDPHPGTTAATLNGSPFPSGTAVTEERDHVLAITATDMAGNARSETIGFAIDRSAPAIAVTGVTAGEVTRAAVTPVVTVEDAHPGTVDVRLNDQPFSSGTTIDAPGSYVLTVTATDAGGNPASSTVPFVIDRTAPVVAIDSPANGTVTQASQVEVVVTATDDRGVQRVEVNGLAAVAGADGKYRVTVPLAENESSLVAVAYDVAGNSATATVTVRRDSTAPDLVVTEPAEGAVLATTTVAVSGSVTDATPVTLTVDGAAVAIAVDGTFHTTVTLALGPHELPIVATDGAGNASTVVRQVTVTAAGAPALVVTEPPEGFVATTATIQVRGTAQASVGGVSLTVNGNAVAVSSGGAFSTSIEAAPGAVTIRLVATDEKGQSTEKIVSGYYGNEPTPEPSGSLAVEIEQPADGTVSGSGTLAVTGRVLGGTPPLQVTVAGVPATVSSGYFSAALTLVEGDHLLVVKATDSEGNVAFAQRNVSIDHTPPYLEVTRPATSPAEANESPYLVQGTVGDVHLAQVRVAGAQATVLAGSFASAVPLQVGDNDIRVDASDLAGNVTSKTVRLHVTSLPPTVTIIEPVDGSDATSPVVKVRATVSATAEIASVSVGTGSATQVGGVWEAEVPLSLGENAITVTATDANGSSGSASVHVRYSDVTQEALAVTGVAPVSGAGNVPPDTLVSVSFNKAISTSPALGEHFTVLAQGSPVEGAFYVAPGGQTVSFIARRAYPEGQRISFRVSGLEAAAGPGMSGDFVSEFTIRPPIPRLWGVVSDELLQPLSGVRVQIEGTAFEAVTGEDGNWSMYAVPAGTAILRYEGPVRSDGSVLETVRRRVFVEGNKDTEDAAVFLYPVDTQTAQRVEAASPVHLAFNGRYPGLSLDVAANGLYFGSGGTTGVVTATPVPAQFLPVPIESYAWVDGLWYLGPGAVRFVEPITISLPLTEPLPAGRYVILLVYDPARQMLTRGGLGRVAADGKTAQSIEPIRAPALDFFGYMALDDAQHAELEKALQENGGSSSSLQGATGFRMPSLRTPPAAPRKRSLLDWALMPFGSVADAQIFDAFSWFAPYSPDMSWMPRNMWVHGRVRTSFLVSGMSLDVSAPTEMTGTEVVLDQNRSVPLHVAFTVTPDARTPEALLQAVVSATRNGVAVPEPYAGAWESPVAQGPASRSVDVPLQYGTTRILLIGVAGSDRLSAIFEAKVEPKPLDPAAPPPTSEHALLTVKKVFDPSTTTDSLVSFFKGWTVEASSATSAKGTTDERGMFSIPVTAYGACSDAFVCTYIPTGTRYYPVRVGGFYGDQIQWVSQPSRYVLCATAYGYCNIPAFHRSDLVVDMRVISGKIRFRNKDGSIVVGAADEGAATTYEGAQLTSISPTDVGTTEVHFFRDDDLTQPIAEHAAAFPSTQPGCSGGHGCYTKIRLGPADPSMRRLSQRCAMYEQYGITSAAAQYEYDTQCKDKNRINKVRLNPGDQLVVFAVNHATGYSGMTRVTVPPVSTTPGLAPGESCPDDDAAGGPIVYNDPWYPTPFVISRCSQQNVQIAADIDLYPPEIEVRVARKVRDGGVQNAGTRTEHLVRHGGMATTGDQTVQVSTQWRVRVAPEPALTQDEYPAAQPADGCGEWPCPPPANVQETAGSLSDFMAGLIDSSAPPPPDAPAYGPGQLLETYCSQLPPGASQDRFDRCAVTESTLVDVPAGVPPIAGHVVRVTNSAVETPANSVFRVQPGRTTSNVQTAFQYIDSSGAQHTINSLLRANYYVHVVGHSLLVNDANRNGTFEPEELETRNPPPPNFEGEQQGKPGLPVRAVPLKDVYLSMEADGTLAERYDPAREHEFRVSKVTLESVNAVNADSSARPLTGDAPEAKTTDVGYQLLLQLLQPDDPSRAGTMSGELQVRLGSDAYGVDCVIDTTQSAQGYVAADCGGQYLYDVLSARDIVYMEVYLSGNSENVLFRYNFNGLRLRKDFLPAGHQGTADASVAPESAPISAYRAASEPAQAVFFVSPAELPHSTARICTDPDCHTVLKSADLDVQADGTFAISNEGGTVGSKLVAVQQQNAGGNWAQRFQLPIPHELAAMPGTSDAGIRTLYLKLVDRADGAAHAVDLVLGTAQGEFVGTHPAAPGQMTLGGVNVVDGHLALTYEDASLPEYESTVRFVRSYDNQNNEIGPMGIGWSHNYEGYVIEEAFGRYAVYLAGQMYTFPRCRTVDRDGPVAAVCDLGEHTDRSHGARLTVGKKTTGDPDVTFEMTDGVRYKFDRLSVRSREKYATTDAQGNTVLNVAEGRRRWVLTAFEDGHGRGEPGIGAGWYVITYYDRSDMVRTVARSGGKFVTTFAYRCIDFEDAAVSADLKRKASAENFGLIESVTMGPISITFEHDKAGNLKKATRDAGSPVVVWEYDYRPLDGVAQDQVKAALNEISQIRVKHDGVLQGTTIYDRTLAWAGFPHQKDRKFEIVDRVTLPGHQGVPYEITYGGDTSRTIKAPDQVTTVLALNAYGNIKTATTGGTVEQMGWGSDVVGENVFPTSLETPGRKLTMTPSDRLLLQTTTLESGHGEPVEGLAGVPLESRTPHARFGIATSITRPTASMAAEVDDHGDVLRGTITGGGTNASFSRVVNLEGVDTSGTDEILDETTYSGDNGFGQPTTATTTLPGATGLASITRTFAYDALGRLVGVTDSAGGSEIRTYDSIGRLRTRTTAGSPGETWTYGYSASDNVLEVVETLAETGFSRKRRFEDGLLESEEVHYGQGKIATWTYAYTAGRLTSVVDPPAMDGEAPTTHTPTYDAAGRVAAVEAGGKSISYGRDAEGKVTSITDQDGLVTTIGYDQLGRPVRWDYGNQDVVRVSRDAAGAVRGQTQGSHVLTIARDALGGARLTKSESTTGGVDLTVEYDGAGRKTHLHDAVTGLDETYLYKDVLGRLTSRVRTIPTVTGTSTSTETRMYTVANGVTTVVVERTLEGRTEKETLTQDVRGRVLTAHREGEATITYGYHALGGLQSVSGGPVALARIYDERGTLVSETRGGITTAYVSDAFGQVRTQQGPHELEAWTFTYDEYGRVLTRTLAAAGTTPAAAWTYQYAGAQVTETGPKATTTRTVNARGRVSLVTVVGDDGTLTTQYGYDGPYLTSEHSVENGSDLTITSGFDDRGRQLSKTEAWSGGTEEYDYQTTTTWTGRTAAVTETWTTGLALGMGRTGSIEVDGLENLVRATFGSTDTWTYDAEGALVAQEPAGESEIRYTYQPSSRRVGTRVQGSETTTYGYDTYGRLASMTDPAGLAHAYGYDAAGRVNLEQHGVESVTWSFDGGGFPKSMQRNGGATYGYTHGPRGELQAVVAPLGTYRVANDAAAMRTGITLPNGPLPDLAFEYDYRGRETMRQRGTASWSTHWSGAVGTTTTPGRDLVTRVMDPRGRVVQATYQPGGSSVAGRTVQMGFDAFDRPLVGKDPSGTSTFEYDVAGRATGVTRGTASVGYVLDGAGRISSVTSTGGTVTYGYDSYGRVSSVGSGGRTTTVEWEPGGARLVGLRDGTLDEARCYDTGGRLHRVVAGPPGTACESIGPGVMSYEYTYDTAGNRNTETYEVDGVAEQRSFHYDSGDRLTGVDEVTAGGSKTYTIAADGTRTAESELAAGGGVVRSVRYTHDEWGGLSGIVDDLTSGTIATYVTDSSGRVKEERRPADNVQRTYEWDADDRLLGVKDGGQLTASYAYDYAGRRISGTTASGTSSWVWDRFGLVEEQLPGSAAALYEPVGGTIAAVGGMRALHDGLESIVGFAGGSRYRHDAWGSYVGAAPGAAVAGVGYAGQRWDADVGLSYAQQRWYQPGVGRFLSEDPVFGDPLQPNSLHPFHYANGNPATLTDPTGEIAPLVIVGVIALGAELGFFGGVIHQEVTQNKGFWEFNKKSWTVVGKSTVAGGAAAAVALPAGAGIGISAGWVATGLGAGEITTAMVAGGAGAYASGFAGDLAAQGTQMAFGDRKELDMKRAAIFGAVLAPLGAAAGGIEGVSSSLARDLSSGFEEGFEQGAVEVAGARSATGSLAVPAGSSASVPAWRIAELRNAIRAMRSQGVPIEKAREMVRSFVPGTIKVRTLPEIEYGLRFYGNQAGARSEYLLEGLPPAGTTVRGWTAPWPGNSLLRIKQWAIPKGTTILEGRIAPSLYPQYRPGYPTAPGQEFWYPGGGIQKVVPNRQVLVEPTW